MKRVAYVPREAIACLFDVPPMDWWKFVPCALCMSKRQEPCVMGDESWGVPARKPHASRIAMARVLHGTLWLLANGYQSDVLGTTPTTPAGGDT